MLTVRLLTSPLAVRETYLLQPQFGVCAFVRGMNLGALTIINPLKKILAKPGIEPVTSCS